MLALTFLPPACPLSTEQPSSPSPSPLPHCLLLPPFSFSEPSPSSSPPPSSLLAVTREENTDLCIPYMCFSVIPVHLWLLISPSRRWVSLSSLLPFSLTFPLLLVRHSLLSCCEMFMLSHTVKWSLSRSLSTMSLAQSSGLCKGCYCTINTRALHLTAVLCICLTRDGIFFEHKRCFSYPSIFLLGSVEIYIKVCIFF